MKADGNDAFDPHNDRNPERSYITADHLAHLHGVSLRTVQRLAKSGKLPQRPDGTFERRAAIEAMVAHKMEIIHPRTDAGQALDQKRADLINRRLDRERESQIDTGDALATIDIVTTAFVKALESLPAQIADNREELARIQLIVGNVVARMQDRFAVERLALETGKRGAA